MSRLVLRRLLKVVFVFIVNASALALFALFFMNVQVSVKMIFESRLCIYFNASALDLVMLFFMNGKVRIKTILGFFPTSLSLPSSL